MTISSDASQMGWGATCVETRTGGAWSVQEQAMHINSQELRISSHTCSEDLPEACFGDFGTLSTGQCHSSGIHQQHGRHSVVSADRTGEGVMDVGSRQGHCPVSPTHSRRVQHHSRHRIRDSSDWMLCTYFEPSRKPSGR